LKGKTTVYRRGLNKYAIDLRKGVFLDVRCAGLGNQELWPKSLRIELQPIFKAF